MAKTILEIKSVEKEKKNRIWEGMFSLHEGSRLNAFRVIKMA